MDLLTIVLIAVGLAMDCFAVSMAQGAVYPREKSRVLLMALLFGLFQGTMPLLSFLAGSVFADWVSRYDYWIALFLLGYIGGKMIFDGCRDREEQSLGFSFRTLLLLSVATSIDAFATGVLFISCPEVVWYAVLIICATSVLFSLIGYTVGRWLGRTFKKFNAEVFGGVVLVLLGVKIFIENAFF